MTNQRYKVNIVDADYYRRVISCQNACPVNTDAQGYVNAVSEGDYRNGYIRARQPNPFASTCGRICAAHCEKACRRGKIDAPITIRALKRFLCEAYGVEALADISITDSRKQAGISLLSEPVTGSALTMDSFSQISRGAGKATKTTSGAGHRVAVIGAGPAGLAAAHDLALMGHEVTVFEAAPAAGGMAILGIPEYRLPRDLLKREIEEIKNLGIALKLNSRLGKDFNLADLKEQGFKAIFIAIGAHKDRGMNIEGVHMDGVLAAVEFLLNVNLGYRAELGDRVVVVGGGDVAVDAARVAARLGEAVYEQLPAGELVTAADAARYALRLGVREVHMVYRGTREEMRASEEELEGALEEGTILHTGRVPNRVIGSGGKVTGLEIMSTRSEYDEKGQRSLVTVPGSESIIDCSSIIMAIGQESDLSFIQPSDGIAVSPRGTIKADDKTLATTAPGIFAGGDVVYGPRTLIEAIADGHKAARAMDNYLKRGRYRVIRRGRMVPVTAENLPRPDSRQMPRITPPKIPLERRTGISEVEMAFDETSALEQSERCLKCHIQTVFNGDLCILCGGCVDVCPWNCYKMVGLDKIDGDERVRDAVLARYGIPLEDFKSGSEAMKLGTVMIKDETRCTRCGLCAERCPTGAITMEAFSFEETLVPEAETGLTPTVEGAA